MNIGHEGLSDWYFSRLNPLETDMSDRSMPFQEEK